MLTPISAVRTGVCGDIDATLLFDTQLQPKPGSIRPRAEYQGKEAFVSWETGKHVLLLKNLIY